ncbi:MAG: hypothetical protein DRP08_04660 [Candidatus Aenigmatarchaeota archaeon]|nr:MAG: hypothetical protein DRP08_04660 [Candidatus Aenigmarchaeota archaeon]
MVYPNWKIESENFSGEPRILLRKIKEEKLDICDFSLSKIINQYINWLFNFKGNIDIAADFLLISSILIFLKSDRLLPRRKIAQEQEEDKLEEILEQGICEYKQIKDMAKELRIKEEERALFFSRPELKQENSKRANSNQQKASIESLATVFAQLSSLVSDKRIKITKEKWSVKDKISQILNWLKKKSLVSLKKLFQSTEDKVEMIAFFLATLELVRTNKINIIQKGLFGEIWISGKNGAD